MDRQLYYLVANGLFYGWVVMMLVLFVLSRHFTRTQQWVQIMFVVGAMLSILHIPGNVFFGNLHLAVWNAITAVIMLFARRT